MRFFLVFLTISCLTFTTYGYGSGISSTVFSLGNFQAGNGGFSTQVMEDMPGTLDDTAHATFLASLFGVKYKVDTEGALSFIQTVQNADGGFSNAPGLSSNLEATRNGILASLQLGATPSANVISYIESLYDSSSNLYRNTPGSTADLRATARALQLLSLLAPEDNAARREEVASNLASLVKSEDGKSYFSTITSDNYFGILVAKLSGFVLPGEPSSWIDYFRARQVPSGPKMGGFYSDEYATEVEVSDSEYAVHALSILHKGSVPKTLINLVALNGYLNSLPPALDSASHAYAALARTATFQEVFKVAPSYVVKDSRFKVVGDRIVEGTLFRPTVNFRTSYGQAHTEASIVATIRHQEKSEERSFSFNPQSQLYDTKEFFDTNNMFGDITMTFTCTWSVVGFDTLSFRAFDTKSIGFDASVLSKATLGDEDFDTQDFIGVGTQFSFNVNLGTVKVAKPSLVSGDFEVILTVIDSSNVVAHSESINGQSNSGPITFNYKLSSAKLPAGRITFRFQVKNDNGVHTTEEVWYLLRVAMVATEIDFERDQTPYFGQTVKVSMEPATHFDSVVSKFESASSRHFFLDIFSAKHVLLATYAGQLVDSKYTFESIISPRFDFIGPHVLSFRYQDAFGNNFPLKNFDSETNDLFDADLKYVVEADLQLDALVGAPFPGELEYGDEIDFTFKIQDALSGLNVQRGAEDATVFLALKHQDKDGKTFISAKVRAQTERDQYAIQWEVDPNAVKDAAKLVVFATDADSNEVPLNFEGAPWEVDVTVGGRLEIQKQVYSTIFDDLDSAFLVKFDLSSKNKKLSGADLSARITFKTQTIATLPVSAGQGGDYQVSWTLDTDRALTGEYIVDIFRNVDLKRADDQTNAYTTAKPFFTVTVNHEGRNQSPLPFKTEFLVLLVLCVTLVIVSIQKTELEKII